MNSILSLRGNYNSEDDSGSDFDDSALIKQPDHLNTENKPSMEIVAAPIVITKYDINASRQVDTTTGKMEQKDSGQKK